MYPIDVVMLGLECPEVWKHIDYSVFEKKVEVALENLPVYELDFLGFKIDHYSLKQRWELLPSNILSSVVYE